ncbi:hypothetical protein NHF46_18095 [Arthrobacter alpinus]|nr:hypothetical protein [Arthrobacter alpinus]
MSTTPSSLPAQLQLHRGGTSVIVDLNTAGTPTIIHWGPATGPLSPPN